MWTMKCLRKKLLDLLWITGFILYMNKSYYGKLSNCKRKHLKIPLRYSEAVTWQYNDQMKGTNRQIMIRSAKHCTEISKLSNLKTEDDFFFFFFQLKSLLEIFTFVIERNIKYQYLILASLILVACIEIVLVFLVQYIQDRSINSIRILTYFMIVSNFGLFIYFRYIISFWPTCWEIWKI